MSTAVLIVGIACGGIGAYAMALVARMRARYRCPGCGERKLVMKRLVRGHVWPPPSGRPVDETLYRCDACGEEFAREGAGPLIARQAFDAGAREPFPSARALPPRDS